MESSQGKFIKTYRVSLPPKSRSRRGKSHTVLCKSNANLYRRISRFIGDIWTISNTLKRYISREISRSYCWSCYDISLSPMRIIVVTEWYSVCPQRFTVCTERYIVWTEKCIVYYPKRFIVSTKRFLVSTKRFIVCFERFIVCTERYIVFAQRNSNTA